MPIAQLAYIHISDWRAGRAVWPGGDRDPVTVTKLSYSGAVQHPSDSDVAKGGRNRMVPPPLPGDLSCPLLCASDAPPFLSF